MDAWDFMSVCVRPWGLWVKECAHLSHRVVIWCPWVLPALMWNLKVEDQLGHI